MRLTHVDIQAYRSLYEVRLDPTGFTVLVGPNNAGKTNLAGALEFLGQAARNGLEVAVGREGGFENLAFRRKRRTTRPVRFAFQAQLDFAEVSRFIHPPTRDSDKDDQIGQILVSYAFELRASSESRDADFRVSSENLRLDFYDDQMRTVLEVLIQRRESDVTAEATHPNPELPQALQDIVDPLLGDYYVDYVKRTLEPTALILNRLAFNVVISETLEQLGRTRLFQLTPVECRLPGSSTPNPELARHGENLPAVVRYMQRNHPRAWSKTLRAMQGIVPGLTAINTHFTVGRRLSLEFVESGARAWTSDEVSDGTIQSLALFTSLFDPRIPLVLIEEPENSVHPWIVKTFVDACREAESKQVLVTTHSPALISYLRPEELQILWRSEEGRTHLEPLSVLDPEAPRLWEAGDINLYELIDGGWVREAVPLGLQ
jgi:predicted ATPase